MSFSRPALLLVLSLVVAACSRGSKGAERPAEAGLEALIGRSDLSGSPVALEGDALVVVVFASWCGPCRAELRALGELRRERPGLRVIGLNAYEEYRDYSDEVRLRRFLDRVAPWLRVVRDDGTLLSKFGGVPKIPTLFVYDRHGRLVREFRTDQRRPPSRAELARAIEEASAI